MKSIIKSEILDKPFSSNLALGLFSPSVLCHINIFCFYNRLQNLDQTISWNGLQQLGYKVNLLVLKLSIDLDFTDNNMFKIYCKSIVKNDLRRWCAAELCDIERNPKLKMFRTIEHIFGRESYIDTVSDTRYRKVITKIGTSSHPLEIEMGFHTNTTNNDFPQKMRSKEWYYLTGYVSERIDFLI